MNELLEALRAILDEGADPSEQLSLIDGWGASMQQGADESAAATEAANARVAELEAEILGLKAHNYELLMASGTAPESEEGGEETGEESGEESGEDDANISIDDLFTKEG